MTVNQLKRGELIQKQLETCKNIIAHKNCNRIDFAHNECSFIKDELFEVIERKKHELEMEFEKL